MGVADPVMEEQRDWRPPIAAATLVDSAASDGATSLSAATVQPAKVERCVERAAVTAGEAPGAGAPRHLARTEAAFSTMNMEERPSSLTSGAIGSTAPLVEMSS